MIAPCSRIFLKPFNSRKATPFFFVSALYPDTMSYADIELQYRMIATHAKKACLTRPLKSQLFPLFSYPKLAPFFPSNITVHTHTNSLYYQYWNVYYLGMIRISTSARHYTIDTYCWHYVLLQLLVPSASTKNTPSVGNPITPTNAFGNPIIPTNAVGTLITRMKRRQFHHPDVTPSIIP